LIVMILGRPERSIASWSSHARGGGSAQPQLRSGDATPMLLLSLVASVIMSTATRSYSAAPDGALALLCA